MKPGLDVLRFGDELVSSASMNEFARRYMDGSAGFLDSPMRSLYLLDTNTMLPEYVGDIGVSETFLARYETFGRPNDPLHEHVLRTGEPASNLALVGWERWRLTEGHQRCGRLHQMGSIVEAPIISEGRVVGNIHFARRDDAPPLGACDVRAAGALGRVLGIALGAIRSREAGEERHREALEALDLAGAPLILLEAKRSEPYCNAAAHALLAEISSPADILYRVVATQADAEPGTLRVTLCSGETATLRALFRETDAGSMVVSLRLEDTWPPPCGGAWANLTTREREVAALVARAHTDAQIAERLFLSRYTVSQYLRQAYRKLGVSSRVGLTRLLLARGADGAPDRGE